MKNTFIKIKLPCPEKLTGAALGVVWDAPRMNFAFVKHLGQQLPGIEAAVVEPQHGCRDLLPQVVPHDGDGGFAYSIQVLCDYERFHNRRL